MEIEFTYRFEAAHRFTKGSTKCSTPHGHTWYVTLSFFSEPQHLNSQQMIEEFSVLKEVWKTFILETVDHSFFHHYADPILPALKDFVPGFRGLVFPGDPTTELIAALFLKKALTFYKNSKVQPVKILIQETETNGVSLKAEELPALLTTLPPTKGGWWLDEAPQSRIFPIL